MLLKNDLMLSRGALMIEMYDKSIMESLLWTSLVKVAHCVWTTEGTEPFFFFLTNNQSIATSLHSKQT